MNACARWLRRAVTVGFALLVTGLLVVVVFLSFMGTQPGPSVDEAHAADVVARVESRGRGTVTVDAEVPYDLDVVTFDVLRQQPLVPGAPAPPPDLEDTVEVVVFDHASWWEDGVDEGELVVFLSHSSERSGPPWRLLFAIDARTGQITGEFDDDLSQDTFAAVTREAGAETPQERIDAFVTWARENGEQRPGAWTVQELSTFYVGQAVTGDVVDRAEPFDVAAWQAQPADERLLPVGPDDPAVEELQAALGLRSVAVAVRPNGAFDIPVNELAVEFVGTGLLGWIPLRDGEPTGLVGAAPVDPDGRVRVLGRNAAGEVSVLQQFGDDVDADQSVPLWWISDGRGEDGPWALVIDLASTDDVGDGVVLRQTSIDELGLLMERAGR